MEISYRGAVLPFLTPLLQAAVDAGGLKPVVNATFPLAELARSDEGLPPFSLPIFSFVWRIPIGKTNDSGE